MREANLSAPLSFPSRSPSPSSYSTSNRAYRDDDNDNAANEAVANTSAGSSASLPLLSSIVTSGSSRASSASATTPVSASTPRSPWLAQQPRLPVGKKPLLVTGILTTVALLSYSGYSGDSSNALFSPFTSALGYYDDPASLLEPEWRWAANVDFVYTWINGTEPVNAALKVKHGGSNNSNRDRDNDELRYSIRSFEEYLPWHTGKIYLVSPPGHIPSWMDTSNPRFQHIDQNTLIPVEDQPTFNSNVVEAFLYRIPGLSSRFIGMNDDYFFKAPIHPSRFFTKDGGIKIYTEWRYAKGVGGGGQWETSTRHTSEVIEKAYSQVYYEAPRVTEHAPFVFYKDALAALHTRFNHALRLNGQHKFRHPEDVTIPILHYEYVVQEGSRCCNQSFEIIKGQTPFLGWTLWPNVNEENWQKVQNWTGAFWHNVNDQMQGVRNMTQLRIAQDQLHEKLQERYPRPSRFEIA